MKRIFFLLTFLSFISKAQTVTQTVRADKLIVTAPSGRQSTVEANRLKLQSGNQANGRILQSDASGNADWAYNRNVIVNTVAELRTITGVAGAKVKRLGYYAAGDGGGDNLYWNSTSVKADNGGTVFQVTGVTTGRWESERSDVVNVKQFGVRMNGTTNDSANLVRVFSAQVKEIHIPNDGVLLTSGNVITNSSIKKIIGNKSQIKLTNSAFRSVLRFYGLTGIVIEGLSVDGNAANNALDNGSYLKNGVNIGVVHETAAILLDSCFNSVVSNCYVSDALATPIVLLKCQDSIIEKCEAFNHRREGIGISGGQSNQLLNNKAWCDGIILSWSCIYTRDMQPLNPKPNHKIIGNLGINSQTAFFTINTNYTQVINNTVRKTASISVTSGVGIRLGHNDSGSDSTLRAWNCIVSNNYVFNIDSNTPFGGASGRRAISADNGSYSVIKNNFVSDCGSGIGVSVSPLNKHITIDNNEIINTANIGIELFNTNDIVITNNYIVNTFKGIRVSAAGTEIHKNTIINNSDTGIEVYFGAATGVLGTKLTSNEVRGGSGTKYTIASRTSQFVKDNIGFDGVNANYTIYDSAAPTSGFWVAGNTVFNSSPSTTSPIGWICVANGTPGTWLPFGLINNYAPTLRVGSTSDTGEAFQLTGTARINGGVDIRTTTGMMIIPRMTQAQRLAIASPQNGGIVYQTDGTAGFYFYVSGAWVLK